MVSTESNTNLSILAPCRSTTIRRTSRPLNGNFVKRCLCKHGYPPDKQEKATLTVLEQAEVLSEEWAASFRAFWPLALRWAWAISRCLCLAKSALDNRRRYCDAGLPGLDPAGEGPGCRAKRPRAGRGQQATRSVSGLRWRCWAM
jgi:hypothetical protein